MFSDRHQRRRRLHQWIRRVAIALFLVVSTAAANEDANEVQTDEMFGGTRSSFSSKSVPGYAKMSSHGGLTRVTADFLSLDGEPLQISFDVDPDLSRTSMRNFGLDQREITTIQRNCRDTRGCSQADLDRAVLRYYEEHDLRIAFASGQRPKIFVDIPEVVRNNRAAVRPVAAALRELGSQVGGDEQWVVEAAVALVQGGLAYRTPSDREAGRETLGFYTPARALEQGFGDCDTKSALLAAILTDLGQSGLIGVRVPGHYLLGMARDPRPGEAFVEYQGRRYVLIEAAGPAQRAPGKVSDRTRAALAARETVRIDPI